MMHALIIYHFKHVSNASYMETSFPIYYKLDWKRRKHYTTNIDQ